MNELGNTCMICCKKLLNKYSLRRHLFKLHQIAIEEHEKDNVNELQFESENDFYIWKAVLEEETFSSYIKARYVHNKGEEYHYYECSRSGHFKPRGEGKKSLKLQNTSKIGQRCPSRITLKVSKSKCFVKFYKDHKGHEADIKHLRLPASFRAAVADQLKAGASVKEVVNNVRLRAQEEGIYSRASLLKTKDLYNIKRSFNVESFRQKQKRVHIDKAPQPHSERVENLHLLKRIHLNNKHERRCVRVHDAIQLKQICVLSNARQRARVDKVHPCESINNSNTECEQVDCTGQLKCKPIGNADQPKRLIIDNTHHLKSEIVEDTDQLIRENVDNVD